jgi:hypothetical protein
VVILSMKIENIGSLVQILSVPLFYQAVILPSLLSQSLQGLGEESARTGQGLCEDSVRTL